MYIMGCGDPTGFAREVEELLGDGTCVARAPARRDRTGYMGGVGLSDRGVLWGEGALKEVWVNVDLNPPTISSGLLDVASSSCMFLGSVLLLICTVHLARCPLIR